MSFDQDCCEIVNHSYVKVEERGRKATFRNEEKLSYRTVRFDGCICKHTLGADWILERDRIGQIIIELKGRNVEHGFKKIMSTAKYLVDNDLRHGKLCALIVSSQSPRASTIRQRLALRFAKEFRGRLHISSSKSEFEFSKLL